MSATDFVVTIHALERMEERFTDTVADLDDVAQAQLIHAEVHDALEAGRHSTVPPIELSARATDRWMYRKQGGYVAWTQDKGRGYVLQEQAEEGLIVLTVLAGEEREVAQKRKLHGKARRT